MNWIYLAWMALLPIICAQQMDISEDLHRYTSRGKIPGLAAAAVLDGKIVAAGASGVRKKGDATKITLEDKFHIGSCTKSMTATLAAILVAEGKIRWDTTVSEIYPDFEIHPGLQKATLLQLLSNSGGIPGDFPDPLWKSLVKNRGNPEAEQRLVLVRSLLAKPPEHPPGSRRVYSNGGFTLAGAMLEKAAGKPYDELLRARLFKPLGLETAGFGAAGDPGKTDQPWGHLSRWGFVLPIEPGLEADNPPAITPAGRVHLSILDFARYANFHLGNGENAPLDRAALDFLHAPVPPGDDYAPGWVVLERDWAGGRTLMHNGSNTMNYALVWLAPRKNFAAVVACNSGHYSADDVCDQVATFLIERFLEK